MARTVPPEAQPYVWELTESTLPIQRETTVAQPLTAEQVQRWKATGALVLDGLLPAPLIHRAREQASARYPQPCDAPLGYQRPYGRPLTSHIRFPMDSAVLGALNDVTVHERLLGAASQLLGSSDLRITQSNILPKYGEADQAAGNQHLHQDYGANQFLVPPKLSPEAVIAIIYYSDAREVEGPTTFVREATAQDFKRSAVKDAPANNGGDAPSRLYSQERAVNFRPGTTLLFRVDTWHRGTGVRPNQRRLTQHIIIRRAQAEWVQSDCWVPRFASTTVDPAFIGRLSPWQRNSLGMPPVGSYRWDLATLTATAARYIGFDTLPYSAVGTAPDCMHAASAPLATLSAEETQCWQTRGWVVLHDTRSLWSADVLTAATHAIEATPIPDCDSTEGRVRPNGAMGGPPLVDAPPFTVMEGDATVASLGELPSNDLIDALAFTPSAIGVVAEMMGCKDEDVRLCRSELVAVMIPPPPPVPRDGEADPANLDGCAVSLWEPQQYSLLKSDWQGDRRTDGVACLLVHNISSRCSPFSGHDSVCVATIETDGVSRQLTRSTSTNGRGIAAVLYDVTRPHTMRISHAYGQLVVCSILLWRRRDAEWIGWETWGKKLSGHASLMSTTMSALQRGLLGWPAVASDYWDDQEAFDGAAERYGHDAMTVYKARI